MVRVMKMAGWKDIKVLNDHYLRLSGIDIKGSTDVLDFGPADVKHGPVLSFRPGS